MLFKKLFNAYNTCHFVGPGLKKGWFTVGVAETTGTFKTLIKGY